MTERIQKIIASRGVTSRRKAEEMITAGRVTCNGKVCLLGESADPDVDIILLDGKPLPSGGEYTYIMLHKPRGFVTTLSDEKGRKNVAELVKDCGQRVYPVGRLDMDSEGLLLLTNDGDFANHLMHPKHNVDKTYLVTVEGFSEAGLGKLGQPIALDGYTIAKPAVKLIGADEKGRAKLEVVIHEGKNRQIRRMCSQCELEVLRLKRVAEHTLTLGGLKAGCWRYLTDEEIKELKGSEQA